MAVNFGGLFLFLLRFASHFLLLSDKFQRTTLSRDHFCLLSCQIVFCLRSCSNCWSWSHFLPSGCTQEAFIALHSSGKAKPSFYFWSTLYFIIDFMCVVKKLTWPILWMYAGKFDMVLTESWHSEITLKRLERYEIPSSNIRFDSWGHLKHCWIK